MPLKFTARPVAGPSASPVCCPAPWQNGAHVSPSTTVRSTST